MQKHTLFQNRPCQLIVHLDRGFSLVDSGLAAPAKIIWSYSFDQLKASADDGNRLLFLDFGEGEIVSIPKLQKLPKYIGLLILFCFLIFASKHLHRSSIWNVARSQWCLYYTIAYQPKYIRSHNHRFRCFKIRSQWSQDKISRFTSCACDVIFLFFEQKNKMEKFHLI